MLIKRFSGSECPNTQFLPTYTHGCLIPYREKKNSLLPHKLCTMWHYIFIMNVFNRNKLFFCVSQIWLVELGFNNVDDGRFSAPPLQHILFTLNFLYFFHYRKINGTRHIEFANK